VSGLDRERSTVDGAVAAELFHKTIDAQNLAQGPTPARCYLAGCAGCAGCGGGEATARCALIAVAEAVL
jgi:hypothetical protein